MRVYYMGMIDFLVLYVSFLNKNPKILNIPNTNIKYWSHSMALLAKANIFLRISRQHFPTNSPYRTVAKWHHLYMLGDIRYERLQSGQILPQTDHLPNQQRPDRQAQQDGGNSYGNHHVPCCILIVKRSNQLPILKSIDAQRHPCHR